MKTGDRATFRDPLSKRVVKVTLLEPVKCWVGPIFTGHAFNVRDDRGTHWTARRSTLTTECWLDEV